MSILRYNETLPAMARAIIRYLWQAGATLPSEELASAVCPESVDGVRRVEGLGSREFQRTLPALEELDIVVQGEGSVTLDDAFALSIAEDADIPHALRRRALKGPLQDLLTSNKGARDFVRASSWFLAQSPWDSPGVWSSGEGRPSIENLQTRRMDSTEDWFFGTDLPWRSFVRWSTFLGLCRVDATTGGVLIPDPTVSIEYELPAVFGGEDRIDIVDFLAALVGQIPILDGGRYRSMIEAKYENSIDAPQENRISTSLSLALVRLEHRKTLRLLDLHDPPNRRRLQVRGDDRFCSHIEWVNHDA